MPPTINAIAPSKVRVTGSPRVSAAIRVPTTGVARRPSDVSEAGRLRFTVAMAQ
jgi:hypothetical protein